MALIKEQEVASAGIRKNQTGLHELLLLTSYRPSQADQLTGPTEWEEGKKARPRAGPQAGQNGLTANINAAKDTADCRM